ncbi:M23 family metallopeptidase [Bdellovibrio sp. HCB337]|uniref:M23 family metallopeptidase n=1 Tax=Bdellovibrio sp. HCB337 TaxID=3394358 RepID=UPI0039A499F1
MLSTQNVLRIAISFCAIAIFGSCATYHTPLSREISQGSLSTPDFRAEGPLSAPDKKISFVDKTDLFDWPVDDARLTRGFLPKKRRPHLGIDLASKRGTPILAAQGGMVIYTGREFRGYGKMILVESGNGWATLYAHMDKIVVQEGQKVSRGQMIGAMGRTGRATGVHLHFEIRKDRGPIDPLPLLPNGSKVASYLRDRPSKN